MCAKKLKPIAFKDNIVSYEEGLPLPYVHYPGHYGAFIGYSENSDDQICLCSCSYDAVANYALLRIEDDSRYSDPHNNFILSSKEFPYQLVNAMLASNVENSTAINNIVFRHKICHQCNNQLPAYRYCHEMYGSVFQQNYGWFVKMHGYTHGIDTLMMKRLKGVTSDDVELAIEDEFKNVSNIGALEFLQNSHSTDNEMQKRARDQNRKIRNLIENEVRKQFGHKNIGEAWTSETILYYIIKDLYRDKNVHRHYRPKFMNGLELDIYIEDLKIAIEYQGIQHYKPVKHWGGDEAYRKLIIRDTLKKKRCRELGIRLIYFKYDEEISIYNVKKKLRER